MSRYQPPAYSYNPSDRWLIKLGDDAVGMVEAWASGDTFAVDAKTKIDTEALNFVVARWRHQEDTRDPWMVISQREADALAAMVQDMRRSPDYHLALPFGHGKLRRRLLLQIERALDTGLRGGDEKQLRPWYPDDYLRPLGFAYQKAPPALGHPGGKAWVALGADGGVRQLVTFDEDKWFAVPDQVTIIHRDGTYYYHSAPIGRNAFTAWARQVLA